nr:hypothetical protein Itr_chr11CG15330 [Ipomoea trifida]
MVGECSGDGGLGLVNGDNLLGIATRRSQQQPGNLGLPLSLTRMQRRWWSWARQRRQPPRHSNSPIAAAARQPRTSSLVDVTTSRTARMKSTSVRERRWVPAKKRVAWQQHAESSRRQLTESTAPSPRPVTSSRLRQRRRSRAICGKRRSPSSVFQQ